MTTASTGVKGNGLMQFGTGTVATPVELRMAEGLTFEQWEQLGRQLRHVGEASKWWIGDWLAHGEWKYGERYRTVLELLERDYGEVRHLAYVAGNVPAAIREPGLTWTHHRLVAKLVPREQEKWLRMAAREHWSTRELVDQLQRALQLPAPGPADPADVDLEQLRFTVPADRAARWAAAAERVDSSLEDWASAVLDLAAAESEGAP